MRSIFLISLLLLINSAFTQKHNFETFNEEDFKGNFIYDFAQKSNGELYIATAEGLAIYDGIDFEILNEEKGLASDFIREIFIDSKDIIWVSYNNGAAGKIEKSKILNFEGTFFSSSFHELASGEMLCLSDEGTFTFKDGKLNKSIQYPHAKELIKLSDVSLLRIDNENSLYHERTDENSSYLLHKNVEFIAVEKNKELIAIISDENLILYECQNERLFKQKVKISLGNFEIDEEISAIIFNEHQVVLSSFQNGLIEINFDKKFESYRSRHIDSENGLQSNHIQTLFVDKEQNLWVGSYGKGVSCLPKNRVISYFQGKDAINVNCIEFSQNRFYIGSNNGVYKIEETEKTEHYLANKRITTLKFQDDVLWIGTENNGLFYLKDQTIRPFLFQSDIGQPSTINCVGFDNNSLIAGTNSGLYIHYLDSNASVLITTNDGLAHNVIESFIIDQQGRFWFDSPNSPIYSYYEGDFTYYKNVEGFESYDLTAIKELKNGRIVFGTRGDGIFCFADGKFRQYSEASGLLSDYIYFIEENEDGSFYCGHKGGISISNRSASSISFWKINNLKQLEYINSNASQIISNSNLWIGTSNGLVNLPNVVDNKIIIAPKLYLPQIIINDSIYKTNETINLPYGNYHVEFFFKAISLANAQSITYESKLEGFDKDWTVVANTKESMNYQTLKDGNYTFKVRLLINDIVIGDEKSITIQISKPIWKKTSFFVFLALGIILLFFVSLKLITLKNKKNEARLIEKVDERTQEISSKNKRIQEINQNLEVLSTQYLKAKDLAEDKTQELEKSIQYAKHIQKATFRKSEYAQWLSKINSYFLIFKPKDIVSGDFYWGAKKEDDLYIAVGDCTGHGVPGALIGMLGVSILNEVTQTTHETDKILNKLRSRIIVELGQSNENQQLQDGLDIALIRLNLNTNLAQFSGAYNPVFIIRDRSAVTTENSINLEEITSNNEQIIFSTIPDRQPVGLYPEYTDFTAYNIQLEKNDQLYLFSDGYVDQFGGPKNKKFMRRRFTSLLLEINQQSAKEQKSKLWETMIAWKGENDQIDDISILGFKI